MRTLSVGLLSLIVSASAFSQFNDTPQSDAYVTRWFAESSKIAAEPIATTVKRIAKPDTACTAGVIWCHENGFGGGQGRIGPDSCYEGTGYFVGYTLIGTAGQKITIGGRATDFALIVWLMSDHLETYATATASGANSWAILSYTLPYTGNYTVLLKAPTKDTFSDYELDLMCSMPPPPCAYSLSAYSGCVGSAAGDGSVTVTASPSNCTGSYTASSNASWITINGGSTGSGPGSRIVGYSIAPNTSSARTGVLTIGGQTLTVTQAANPTTADCSYSLSPSQEFVSASGGESSVTVTGSPSGCSSGSYTASTTDPWISITGGATGQGSGIHSVGYSAQPNNSKERSGSILIADQTFVVSQGGVAQSTAACIPDPRTACLLNGRFRATVRYRGVFDGNAVDTDALAKTATGFADESHETVFFYFNSPSNVEMVLKMLDQGNLNPAGQRTIAVLFGSATPLRTELTITDTQTGAVKRYSSQFLSHAGNTDFTAFVK